MNIKLLKQYLMSDCLSINITLNNQLSYWKGQKKWIETAPTWKKFYEYFNTEEFVMSIFESFGEIIESIGTNLDLSIP